MNAADRRTLRFQALLMLGLFAGSTGIAVGVLVAKPWITSKLANEYKAAPHLQALIQKATTQPLAATDLANSADSIALYDDWLAAGDRANPDLPAKLCKIAPQLFIERAQRTVIHGPPEMSLRAVNFLARSQTPEAIQALSQIQYWAARHGDEALARRALDGQSRLKQVPFPLSRPTSAPASGGRPATFQSGDSHE